MQAENSFMTRTLLFMLLVFYTTISASAQLKTPPNIILILVDDLGYSDLASYGNKNIKTPNIDALGTRGARFTQAYVTSPICAPSRMGIITATSSALEPSSCFMISLPLQ